jgi:formylglycine-generating enzyme required for sulfatase activity/tRNA A-37 threonylcarbamoyl transferase component Bud32
VVVGADATRATVHAGEAPTLPLGSVQDPAATVPMNLATEGTGATRRQTGTLTRLGRTRTNADLPSDARALDLGLQLSRPSVLSDLGRSAPGALPPGVQKLIDEHGTDGRYAVERPLAQGGMGAVLLIRDGDFQRPAAMKVMLARYAHNAEALERFLAEAQITAQLEHPNIVPIHDVGMMDDGTVYFTMKFIEGQSLGAVAKGLRSEDPAVVAATRREWPDERLIAVFLKVLDGLGYAHHRGVLHRDLKPDNIMLGGHGEVLVVDWGIAKVVGSAELGGVAHLRQDQALSQTMDGSAVGTLHYMPPEQARGDLAAVDQRSDIYALGATLYEMLCGHRPVSGSTASELLRKVALGEIIPIRSVHADLDQDLEAIVAKAMAPAPADRYQDCAAFAADLRSFLAGLAVAARRRNLIERIGAWVARHRRQVAIAAGLAAVLVATGVGSAWWAGRSAAARADTLLATAQSAAAAGNWEDARAAAEQVLGIRSDGQAFELRAQAVSALAAQATEREAAVRATADRERAERLTAAAAAAAAGMRWAEARDQAKAALAAAPLPAAQDLLAQAVAALANVERAEREALAASRKQAGDAALVAARALPLLDPALATALATARTAYAQSAADGIAVAGVDAALAELGALQGAATQAQRAAARDAAAAEQATARHTQYAAALVAAEQAVASGNLDGALEQVAVARRLVPDDERAVAQRERLLGLIAERDATRQRSAAQAQARATADAALVEARAAVAAVQVAKAERAARQAEAEDLARRLAASALADKAPLFAARAAVQLADTRIAEQWALAEGTARSAMDALADQPGIPAAAEARTLLIALYRVRHTEARSRGALAETAAFANLLRRLAADPDQGADGRLRVTGPAGTVLTVRRLVEDGAGRLLPQEPTLPVITLPGEVALGVGRYQVTAGEDEAAVMILPGAPSTLVWAPAERPVIPGQRLRWVPLGGNGVWLAEDEVTVEQWAAFLAEPAQRERLRVTWAAYRNLTGELALYPRTAGTPDESGWVPAFADGDRQMELTGVSAALDPRQPVRGIDRADAQAYCQWLAARLGRSVRLPTAKEWQQAASAGDERRLHPWGPGGDPALATSAVPPKGLPPAVGSSPSDRGPFGHRDLAGSVREWISDPGLVFQGRVAGGAWSDEDSARLRSDAVESLPPDATFAAIGFRILVEP